MTPLAEPCRLNYAQALVVGCDAEAAPGMAAVIGKSAREAGLEMVSVGETEVMSRLRRARQAGAQPAVIVLGPGVANLAAVTRALQSMAGKSHVIFLQHKNQDAQKKLAHVPRAGLHWSISDANSDAISKALQAAVQAVRRRVRLQTSLDQANAQLNSLKEQANAGFRRLILSDRYLNSFLAHAQDAIVAIDPDCRVLYWSAGAERLFGLSHREAIGADVGELNFWSPKLQKSLKRIVQGSETLSTEVTCTVPRGEVALETVFSAVRDEAGDFIGTSLIIRDVSVRNKILEAERAERSQVTRVIDSERQHLRSLFKQAPGFIAVTTGPQHVFEVANDAYYQIIGHRSILGKPARDALPEMQEQEFLTQLDQVYYSGEPYVGRGIAVSVQRKPGAELETLYVDFVFQPIIEADGRVTGIFCQGSDITEHKATQEKLADHQKHLETLVTERTQALEKSQRALQRSQKLEAIGKLTGGVAHDFNNVLQIIAGNLQLLQLTADPADMQKYLNSAVDAVERGAKLSSQLLAFARRQPLQPLAVNLGRILRGMDDLLRRALGETIEIETIVAGGLWNTLVDPHQLENVILNLSINARDAMPEGGKLTLELGNAMLDDQYVLTQPDVPAGQYVMLAISDTGKGMTPEVMERAFDPFFTTKKEGEGTGLGLSMAYGFVKQSGGHIKIYSEPGSGTTFKIYLPRSFQPEVEAPLALSGPAVGGSETVLVVEDDPAVQETAVRILMDLGYKVLKASDGQGALNIMQSGLSIDVLFTDVVMPGPVRSPDLAKQAKRLFPDIAVLFTSGYTQNAIVHGGRLDPGVELLSKPYRREDLARKIRHVLANVRQQAKNEVTLRELGQDDEQASPGPMRILVVEDNLDSQAAVCELLSMLGHTAKGVASAEEAERELQEHTFDLLFTDVNLPGISGTELAQKVVERHPHLKIIIASGYGASLDNVDRSVVVLPKPFDLSHLRHALASFQ